MVITCSKLHKDYTSITWYYMVHRKRRNPSWGIKELAVTSGIVSIFRASAGVVPWNGAELYDITKLWIRVIKQAWEYLTGMDSYVIIIDQTDGGRRCPSGREVWTDDVLTVMDQCIQLPGEISAILLDRLKTVCFSKFESASRNSGNTNGSRLIHTFVTVD
jgi:hypothetical protein